MNTWEKACDDNRKQTEFVKSYVLEHFGPEPGDPAAAQSEALEAFRKSMSYDFRLLKAEELFGILDRQEDNGSFVLDIKAAREEHANSMLPKVEEN